MTSLSVELTALNVYPIKSAAGISVTEWDLDDFGLRFDRRWMVVDRGGRFLTQRTHSRLALIRPRLGGETLRLEADGAAPLELPLEPSDRIPITTQVWKQGCEGLYAGEHAARWLTALLQTECSLVYMPPDTVRPANPAFAPPGTRVSFADAYPLLLISEESLSDLNGRMATPVPMNRFRPNLVVRGGGAFFEDGVSSLRVDGLELRVVKPCDRCVLTTVDQATGQRGVEPLCTLATYRKRGGEVYFGQNVVHLGRGRLRVGQRLDCSGLQRP